MHNDDIRKGGASLIIYEDDVRFVYWQDPVTRACRQVTVKPPRNTIVAIVPHRVPLLHVRGCQVIIRRVPAAMLMRKAAEADQMPDWCMLLFQREQTAMFCGPLEPDSGKSVECIVCYCSSGRSHGLTVAEADHDLYRCATCLVVWHLRCSRALKPPCSGAVQRNLFHCALCM